MLRILSLAIAVLIVAASAADATYCGQSSELAAAQARWAALRQSRVGPAEAEKICRTYGKNFYEAVEVRQAAALCEDSAVRKHNLDTRSMLRSTRSTTSSPSSVHRLVTRRATTWRRYRRAV
jgi:hypothetical protein